MAARIFAPVHLGDSGTMFAPREPSLLRIDEGRGAEMDDTGSAQVAGTGSVRWDAWIKTVALALGALGSISGVVATLIAGANKSHLDTLQSQFDRQLKMQQFQVQTSHDFATGIHNVRDILAAQDKDGGNRAMVEFSSLYSMASDARAKLVLIEIAQVAKQDRSMDALSVLVGADGMVQAPNPSDVQTAAAIKTIIRQHANATFAVADAAKAAAQRSKTQAAPPGDPPLTESKNSLVRANANLLAALPADETKGWIFVGDVSGPNLRVQYAPLDPVTRTTSAVTVPPAGKDITACEDLNVRSTPFQSSGALGSVVGIARHGTGLVVDNVPPALFPSRSVVDNHPITARWVHVTLKKQSATAVTRNAGC